MLYGGESVVSIIVKLPFLNVVVCIALRHAASNDAAASPRACYFATSSLQADQSTIDSIIGPRTSAIAASRMAAISSASSRVVQSGGATPTQSAPGRVSRPAPSRGVVDCLSDWPREGHTAQHADAPHLSDRRLPRRDGLQTAPPDSRRRDRRCRSGRGQAGSAPPPRQPRRRPGCRQRCGPAQNCTPASGSPQKASLMRSAMRIAESGA